MGKRAEPILDFLPEAQKRSPGKKDTRKWCKGKEGVEHVVALETNSWTNPNTHETVRCRWTPWGKRPHYTCWCRKRCTTCGKVMEDYLRDKTQCPYWVEQPSEEEFARLWPTWAAHKRR